MKKATIYIITILLLGLLLVGCGQTTAVTQDTAATAVTLEESVQTSDTAPIPVAITNSDNNTATADTASQPTDWNEETHGKTDNPDYDTVFPDDMVNAITITIDPDDWQAMNDELTELLGEQGSNNGAGAGVMGQGNGRPPLDGAPNGNPPAGGPPAGGPPADGGLMPDGAPAGGPGGNNVAMSEIDPSFVPATITFNDDTWDYVGIRFKGNSSLTNAWSSGGDKLSFKLDFDEFEDEYPQTEDQRFYGFKQLSLKNNFHDNSFLRETVASDLYEEAGLAVSETAFYEVYVDYGEGPVYFGLYTAVEEVDDTVIEDEFSDDGGNLYKPEGATFAEGTFDPDQFAKKSNEDEADWSDIEALFAALHADTRTTDPATWRSDLEAVFDVDTFLDWLAMNTVIQNWDTYGRMSHNFYLYNNPETGQLTWIPWDSNEALYEGNRGGSFSLSLEEVGDDWPLISYLMADEVYEAQYAANVEAFSAIFTHETMTAKYEALAELVAPSVSAESGEYTYLQSYADFETAVADLIIHVSDRTTAVDTYLASR